MVLKLAINAINIIKLLLHVVSASMVHGDRVDSIATVYTIVMLE